MHYVQDALGMLKVVRSKGRGPAANGSCVASGHTQDQALWSTWEVGPDSQCGCAPGQAGWEQASSLWQICCGCELAWCEELAQWVHAWEVVCPSSREVGLAAAGAQAGHKCCAASASSSAPSGETRGCHLQRPPRGSLAPIPHSLPLQWSVRSHLVQFCPRADFDEQWDFLHRCEAGGVGSAAMSAVCCTCGWYFACSLPLPPLSPQPCSFKYVLIMAA